MRAAHLEWYEQGDIWDRLTQQRPLPTDIPAEKITGMASTVKQTLLADTTPGGPLLNASGPLAPIATWAQSFRAAGSALGAATREGTLQRGLREIISYAIIFHWNRLGLATRTQAILAHTARIAILETPAASAQRDTEPPVLVVVRGNGDDARRHHHRKQVG
jgi:thiopeptide-type bacteriocin biosynthesis protein